MLNEEGTIMIQEGGVNVALRATTAVLLLLIAALLWWAGGRDRQLAAAQHALVTLQPDEAVRRFDALDSRGILDRLFGTLWANPDVESSQAAARYWAGAAGRSSDRSTDRPNDRTTDPTNAFAAANAAYRAAVAPGGDWRAVTARLDDVIARYAEILRSDPGHRDAAYNYEFVVRYRTAIAARQRDLPPAGDDDRALTLHGIEGTPPQGTGMQQFRMLVPMQPDERREAEEAGQGGRRVRKG